MFTLRKLSGILFGSLVSVIALRGQTDRHGIPPHYRVFDVGTLGGSSSSFYNFDLTGGSFTPRALNQRGELAGASSLPGDTTAGSFIWSDGKLRVLPTLPGGGNSIDGGSNAFGINDKGVAVGISDNGATSPTGQLYYHAVEWRDGRVHQLPDLGGNDSWANFITDFGLAVGFAYNTTPDSYSYYGTQYHAAAWLGREIFDLGTLGGTDSEAWRANGRGDVVGISLLNTPPVPPFGVPQEDAFLWSDGSMKDLGTAGGGFSTPSSVNSRGEVTVISFDSTNQYIQSYLWSRGSRTMLDPLGGLFYEAVTLNRNALIVGAASSPNSGNALAAVWERSGHGSVLGTLPDDTGSIALGLNSQGVVVGGSGSVSFTSASQYRHAFIWESSREIRDLNTLVSDDSPLTLNVAYEINDAGAIAGLGTTPSGETHAFVLLPDWDCQPGTYVSAAAMQGVVLHSLKMQSLLEQFARKHLQRGGPPER